MLRVKVLLIAFMFAAVAPLMALQDVPPDVPAPEPINWLQYAALALNAVLIPLAANLLKRLMPQMPPVLKMLLPLVAGSLLTMAEAYLLGVFGVPIDLSLIEQVLLGGGVAGLGAAVAFKHGETHGEAKQ